MALIECCGFAIFKGVTLGNMSTLGWTRSGTLSTFSNSEVSTGRTATDSSLYVPTDAGNWESYVHQFPRPVLTGTCYTGFAWYCDNIASGAPIVWLLDPTGAPWVSIATNGASKIVLRDNVGTIVDTSASALTGGSNIWRYVEVGIGAGTSSYLIEVRVNGVTVISHTLNYGPPTAAGIGGIQFGQVGTNFSSAAKITDWYVCDDTGARNNGFLGDCRVETLLPTADGATLDWTVTGGSGSHVSALTEAAVDSDTSYVRSTAIGERDTYVLSDLASTAGTVKAVQITNIARRENTNPTMLGGCVRTGGANYDSPISSAPAATYKVVPGIHEFNPGTAATWTASEVNAMEAGPVITS